MRPVSAAAPTGAALVAPITGPSFGEVRVWPMPANTDAVALEEGALYPLRQEFGAIPLGVYTGGGLVLCRTCVEGDPGATEPRTEQHFLRLADSAPALLAALVRSGVLRNSQLTFAAEAIGSMREHDLAIALLRELVSHSSPLVREGAIYGLAKLRTAEAIALLRAAERDSTPWVARAASESLEDL